MKKARIPSVAITIVVLTCMAVSGLRTTMGPQNMAARKAKPSHEPRLTDDMLAAAASNHAKNGLKLCQPKESAVGQNAEQRSS